jgi:2-dehydropantoate 2-reductase
MRIAMMGSGGVGGFFGGRLAHAGYDVSFVARGAHLAAMRERGLTIENAIQGDIHVPRVRVTDDPASLGTVDLVILSVKLWDTQAAARAVKPIVGPGTAVLSLQNGVIKDDILRGEFEPAAVMGGVGYVATHIARPGVIHQTGTMQRIVVGEYDGRPSERARFLHEALLKAGVAAELSADVRRSIWEKYVFLVGLSATTTTMRSPIGPIRENPQTRAFLHDLMREVVAVGRALGVALPEDYADARLAFADGVPADMTSSMHHDLERGNRLEVDWLSGGVVALGRKVGVATPANRAVCDILALSSRSK